MCTAWMCPENTGYARKSDILVMGDPTDRKCTIGVQHRKEQKVQGCGLGPAGDCCWGQMSLWTGRYSEPDRVLVHK